MHGNYCLATKRLDEGPTVSGRTENVSLNPGHLPLCRGISISGRVLIAAECSNLIFWFSKQEKHVAGDLLCPVMDEWVAMPADSCWGLARCKASLRRNPGVCLECARTEARNGSQNLNKYLHRRPERPPISWCAWWSPAPMHPQGAVAWTPGSLS